MSKQINLLRPDMLPGFGPMQLPAFIIAITVAILLGCGWVALAWFERQALLSEEARWQAIMTNDLVALENFQAKHPNLVNEQELQAEYEELLAKLGLIRDTYSGLAAQVENKVDGFQHSLSQLTQYDVDGLWLDEIRLLDGNRSFMLQGFARDPELIPTYLQQLGQSSFAGISIQQLSVNREQDQRLWRFQMSNGSLDAQGGN